jgi:hypothetical protein
VRLSACGAGSWKCSMGLLLAPHSSTLTGRRAGRRRRPTEGERQRRASSSAGGRRRSDSGRYNACSSRAGSSCAAEAAENSGRHHVVRDELRRCENQGVREADGGDLQENGRQRQDRRQRRPAWQAAS